MEIDVIAASMAAASAALILFSLGLRDNGWPQAALAGKVLVATALLPGLVAVALVLTTPLALDLWTGIALCLAAAGSTSAGAFAGSNGQLSGLGRLIALQALVSIPAIAIVGGGASGVFELDRALMALGLVLVIQLLPLLAELAMAHWRPNAVARLAAIGNSAGSALLLVVIGLLFVIHAPTVFGRFGLAEFGQIAFAAVVPVAMVWLVFGPRAELRVLAMGAVRNLSPVFAVAPIVGLSGADYAAVLAYGLVMYLLIAMLLAACWVLARLDSKIASPCSRPRSPANVP